MLRILGPLLVLCSLFTPGAVAGRGQAPSTRATTSVEQELAGIRAALQDIATLMRQQLETSNRDVVLRQIEIKNARLVPVEQELRAIRNQVEGQETELARLEERMQELEETSFYSENEEEKSQARRELSELEKYATQLRSMMTSAQARELETLRRIDALEAEIATLEERLR